ncbi:hypothetical protein ZEAMMB73_Zm00001d038230 [Zea mays]|uniref:Uncharacterized protein n=1 Tax=Zea mays TaxID=4577 RepID=A0A1D6M4N4_MAIZE|nr:hypothetical protein ZEAMMB73_Zm00001d038230 [Zea mays]
MPLGDGAEAADFVLPNELLAALPRDPYEQLDLARRITTLVVSGQVSGLEQEAGRMRAEAAGKDRENAELRERVVLLDTALQETNARLRSPMLTMPDLLQAMETFTQEHVIGIPLTSNHGTKNFRNYKRKLSFGAKVLQAGGIDKVFREYFAVEKDEKLRKAFQCYLSTTAGPIAGMLFISTKKIAFHSDRPLSFTSPKGGSTRVPYKVLIPTERMKSASVRILYFLSVSFFVGTELCCRY